MQRGGLGLEPAPPLRVEGQPIPRMHILLVALGASLLVSYWLPPLLARRPPAAPMLLMVCGIPGSLLFPRIVAGIDRTENPTVWELAAELVVIVVLFATVLRIDDLGGWRLWRPTFRLLAVTMPLTIAAVALLGLCGTINLTIPC